ncbi:MAG: hypothetical protein EXS63_02900 [Candidatus Omnitrophica bacterium]|nr:hypothetical protein [Candidatus Omnitrophota bacterium]
MNLSASKQNMVFKKVVFGFTAFIFTVVHLAPEAAAQILSIQSRSLSEENPAAVIAAVTQVNRSEETNAQIKKMTDGKIALEQFTEWQSNAKTLSKPTTESPSEPQQSVRKNTPPPVSTQVPQGAVQTKSNKDFYYVSTAAAVTLYQKSTTGVQTKTLADSKNSSALDVSSDGKVVVFGGADYFTVMNLQTGQSKTYRDRGGMNSSFASIEFKGNEIIIKTQASQVLMTRFNKETLEEIKPQITVTKTNVTGAMQKDPVTGGAYLYADGFSFTNNDALVNGYWIRNDGATYTAPDGTTKPVQGGVGFNYSTGGLSKGSTTNPPLYINDSYPAGGYRGAVTLFVYVYDASAGRSYAVLVTPVQYEITLKDPATVVDPATLLKVSTSEVKTIIVKNPSNWMTTGAGFQITNNHPSVGGFQLYRNDDATYTAPDGTVTRTFGQGVGFNTSSGGLGTGSSTTIETYINNNLAPGIYRGSYIVQAIAGSRYPDVVTVKYEIEVKNPPAPSIQVELQKRTDGKNWANLNMTFPEKGTYAVEYTTDFKAWNLLAAYTFSDAATRRLAYPDESPARFYRIRKTA